MRRIARSGCEPRTRPSRSTYENSNPDLSSIPRIIPIRLASTRGNHANETKERTFFNILLAASLTCDVYRRPCRPVWARLLSRHQAPHSTGEAGYISVSSAIPHVLDITQI